MHIALQKHNWSPDVWLNMTQKMKLFVIASHSVKVEDDKKRKKDEERKRNSRKRGR
jgi:hypothetical protein